MSVFSPVTWSMGAVQLVSTTTSQLATLNSIQAAFVASTYWEQETTGTSTAGYKYIVVRPKAALGSIYADFRIFFKPETTPIVLTVASKIGFSD